MLIHQIPILYWRAEGQGGGGGGAADAGGGGTPPPAAGADAAAAAAAAAAAGTSAAGAEKTWSFKEDRTNWINPDKFKQAEAATNRTVAELERARATIADQQRRMAALAGVTQPRPEDAEAQAIADAFFALPQFAHLKYVTPEFVQRAVALMNDGESITAARDHVWNAHTDRFLDRLDTAFASEIGVDTLTEGQQRKLRAAFGARIPDEQSDPQGYAAFARRYEANDDTLIDEFLKEFVSDFVEPARRQATIRTTRPPVPRSGPAAPVVTQKAKPDYSNMNVQQMLEAAEKEAETLGR